MDNVAYDLLKKFPLPPENKVWGEVSHNFCFATLFSNFGEMTNI